MAANQAGWLAELWVKKQNKKIKTLRWRPVKDCRIAGIGERAGKNLLNYRENSSKGVEPGEQLACFPTQFCSLKILLASVHLYQDKLLLYYEYET